MKRNRGAFLGLILGSIGLLFLTTAGDFLNTGLDYGLENAARRSASKAPTILSYRIEVADGDTLRRTFVFGGGVTESDSVDFLTPSHDSTYYLGTTTFVCDTLQRDTTYYGIQYDTIISRYDPTDTTFIGPDTFVVLPPETTITCDTTLDDTTVTVWEDTTKTLQEIHRSTRKISLVPPAVLAMIDAPVMLYWRDVSGHRDTLAWPVEIYNSASAFPSPIPIPIEAQLETLTIYVGDSIGPCYLVIEAD